MISHVVTTGKFFKYFKLHTPYELITFVVCEKFTCAYLEYQSNTQTLKSFYEDSLMQLTFVMFIVRATLCGLNNHQHPRRPRVQITYLDPPKSTDQFLIVTVILNLIGTRSSMFLWQMRVKQVSQVLLYALTQIIIKFGYNACCHWLKERAP